MSNATHSLQHAESAAGLHTIQKILVVLDAASTEHMCIEKAVRLASSFGCTVELYICDCDRNVPESWTPLTQYRSILRDRRLAMLEALAAPIRERCIHVITESEWHDPLERGVIEHAIRSQADLVLKDAHRQSEAPYLPFPSTDRGLIKNLPMPLLLVRSTAWPEHPAIAVCVDPCHPAERPPSLDESLLKIGCSIGRALIGDVTVLHALEVTPHHPHELVEPSAVEADYQRQRAAVAEVANRAGVSGEALRFRDGRFPESLIQLVKGEKADLLVMGVAARPRSGRGTAGQILEQTDSDLLVVKPTGFISAALFSDRNVPMEDD